MISHLWSYRRALPVEHDNVGLLFGHVAIDTVLCERMICPSEDRRIRFVTAQAFLRKVDEIVLSGMDVVAGSAGHGRGAEATALFQQFHLVAMNIERGAGIG